MVSRILSGGLEVPLSLTFSCKEKWVVNTMEELILNITEISQLAPTIARTRKRMIIKLLFLNQKTRKMGRGKKKSIRENRFTNRLDHTCCYCNRLINSPFCTFLKSKYTSTKKIPLLFSYSQAKKIRQ